MSQNNQKNPGQNQGGQDRQKQSHGGQDEAQKGDPKYGQQGQGSPGQGNFDLEQQPDDGALGEDDRITQRSPAQGDDDRS